MTERPNLNELAKEIHKDNKAKGFHDEDWSNEHCLCLVISELMEAVEADRASNRNKNANLEIFNRRIDSSRSYKGLIPEISKERAYQVIYDETIKGSIAEELADAVIRLLDLAGKKELYISVSNSDNSECIEFFNKKTFTEQIYSLCNSIFNWSNHLDETINNCIYIIEIICKTKGIDLYQHVSLKLKYNKTRPYKHGKEY